MEEEKENEEDLAEGGRMEGGRGEREVLAVEHKRRKEAGEIQEKRVAQRAQEAKKGPAGALGHRHDCRT